MRIRDFVMFIILLTAAVIFITSLLTNEVASFLIGGIR
jgi:hypothetical protein